MSCILMAAIFIQSSYPPLKILALFPGLDKAAHFIVFCILTLLILSALHHLNDLRKFPVMLSALILAFTAGLLDELHQSFVPERNANFFDLLSNLSGSLLAITLYKVHLIRQATFRVSE